MFKRSTGQLHFGMPECCLSVVCGKQIEVKRTSNDVTCRTGAGGDPDAAAIPVVDDDKARKVHVT